MLIPFLQHPQKRGNGKTLREKLSTYSQPQSKKYCTVCLNSAKLKTRLQNFLFYSVLKKKELFHQSPNNELVLAWRERITMLCALHQGVISSKLYNCCSRYNLQNF